MKTGTLLLLFLFFAILALAYCNRRSDVQVQTGAGSNNLLPQTGQTQTLKLQNDKEPPTAGVEATIIEFDGEKDTGILEGNDGRTYKVECANPELQDPVVGSIFISNGDSTFKPK
jgi:hypothetical protein